MVQDTTFANFVTLDSPLKINLDELSEYFLNIQAVRQGRKSAIVDNKPTTTYNTFMDTDSLQKLGLTANEVVVYTYLLRRGVSIGREIYIDNELDKSSAYEALINLQNKGLIYTLGQTRNQRFGAISADKLHELVEEKEKEIQKIKSDVSEFVKNIDEVAKQSYKSKNVRVIEGEDGFKQWAFARLEGPNNSIIRELVSYNLHDTFIKDYDEYSREMPKRRVLAGIKMRSLVKKEDTQGSLKSLRISNPKLLKEVRVLPDNFQISSSFATFGNKTSFLRKKDGKFLGVIIEDKLITSLLNSMFDYIWAGSKKV